MSAASKPTTAGAMTSSSINHKLEGGPSITAPPGPIPVNISPGKPNVRSAGVPVNHFQSVQALPHMIHPARGLGVPK